MRMKAEASSKGFPRRGGPRLSGPSRSRYVYSRTIVEPYCGTYYYKRVEGSREGATPQPEGFWSDHTTREQIVLALYERMQYNGETGRGEAVEKGWWGWET